MADPITRLHYFNHQFLREEDFTDEQNYHLGMRRRHNRLLHTWGVAEGLRLSAASGASRVTVSPGTAIDGAGRELVLPNSVQTRDLSGLAGRDVFVTVSYAEEQAKPTTETGAEGNTRWEEKPAVGVSEDPPEDPSEELILGRAKVDAAGSVASLDEGEEPHRRRSSGVTGGDLRVASLAFSHNEVAESQWPRMRLERSPLRTELQGALRVAGDVATEGTFTGRLADGSVGTVQLVNGAVTEPRIGAGAVSEPKLANGAVSNRVVQNLAVTTDKLQTLAVTEPKLAANAVSEAKLAINAVTEPKLATNAVTETKLATNAVTETKLATNAVTETKLATNAVTELKLAANAVTEPKLGTNSVSRRALGGGVVGDAQLDTGVRAKIDGAFPSSGGSISGRVEIVSNQFSRWWNTSSGFGTALVIGTGPTVTGSWMTASVSVRSDVSGLNALAAQSPNASTYGLFVSGKARITGGIDPFIIDTFINASGQPLRTGDVVKLKGTPVRRFRGDQNKMPVTEVTLVDHVAEPGVIGVVDGQAPPDPDEPDRRTDPEDTTTIADGEELFVVTFGCYAHCRVDATAAPIDVGDLLTSSSRPGHAQAAAEPRLGTVIGKALEPLREGTGYIAVLVNLQ